jgi:hypothetical protein
MSAAVTLVIGLLLLAVGVVLIAMLHARRKNRYKWQGLVDDLSDPDSSPYGSMGDQREARLSPRDRQRQGGESESSDGGGDGGGD